MKILIPIIGFDKAGGYRVLSELANGWLDMNHEVTFLVDYRASKPYFPTRAKIVSFDVNGVLKIKKQNANFFRTGNAPLIFFGMFRALRQIASNYDIVLANHSLTSYPVALSGCKRSSRFYYVQAYEPEYYAHKGGWKSKILQLLSEMSYKLPFTQIANAPIYVNHPRIRAQRWIPPGIDDKVFYRRPTEPFFSPEAECVLGVIGRREAGKGTIYALKAFEHLALSFPKVRLKVAYGNLPEGWSHERAEVVVPKDDSELSNFYRSVDIMLAPGTVQLGACHYPVIEAMACGTPVITTGYLPADTSNAWIVPVADSAAIAVAVISIANTPPNVLQAKLDLSLAATTRFHWKKIASDFVNIFKDAVR